MFFKHLKIYHISDSHSKTDVFFWCIFDIMLVHILHQFTELVHMLIIGPVILCDTHQVGTAIVIAIFKRAVPSLVPSSFRRPRLELMRPSRSTPGISQVSQDFRSTPLVSGCITMYHPSGTTSVSNIALFACTTVSSSRYGVG